MKSPWPVPPLESKSNDLEVWKNCQRSPTYKATYELNGQGVIVSTCLLASNLDVGHMIYLKLTYLHTITSFLRRRPNVEVAFETAIYTIRQKQLVRQYQYTWRTVYKQYQYSHCLLLLYEASHSRFLIRSSPYRSAGSNKKHICAIYIARLARYRVLMRSCYLLRHTRTVHQELALDLLSETSCSVSLSVKDRYQPANQTFHSQ